MSAVAAPVTSDSPARAWRALGASAAEAKELLAYTGDAFMSAGHDVLPVCALPDEPHVETWKAYVREAAHIGAAACLTQHLVQLRFPVADGMSASDAYRAATRRGELAGRRIDEGARFESPETISIFVHPTVAGAIPVIVAGARSDFETLVQALTRRNEPTPIPASMGACIVAGYNNWDRFAQLRARSRPGAPFHELAEQREAYQDRFIILSSGPYSGVGADDLGLSEPCWQAMSIIIRLEHECAHYVTRRLLGAMRNCMFDEVIADYAGIVAGCGRYRADWFLRFVGLERFPVCRENGRLWNYRGDPPLSAGAFEVLQLAVVRAAANLERFDAEAFASPRNSTDRARMVVALARTGLERLAGPEALALLGAMVGGAER